MRMRMRYMHIHTILTSHIHIPIIVRGFLARQRVRNIMLFNLSKATGVLVAMKHTEQGESGWYAAPDGNIYYFVLRNEDWIQVAGPLTQGEYSLVRQGIKQKQRETAPGIHPLYAPYTPPVTPPILPYISHIGVLTKVDINVMEGEDEIMEQGEVCVIWESVGECVCGGIVLLMM